MESGSDSDSLGDAAPSRGGFPRWRKLTLASLAGMLIGAVAAHSYSQMHGHTEGELLTSKGVFDSTNLFSMQYRSAGPWLYFETMFMDSFKNDLEKDWALVATRSPEYNHGSCQDMVQMKNNEEWSKKLPQVDKGSTSLLLDIRVFNPCKYRSSKCMDYEKYCDGEKNNMQEQRKTAQRTGQIIGFWGQLWPEGSVAVVVRDEPFIRATYMDLLFARLEHRGGNKYDGKFSADDLSKNPKAIGNIIKYSLGPKQLLGPDPGLLPLRESTEKFLEDKASMMVAGADLDNDGVITRGEFAGFLALARWFSHVCCYQYECNDCTAETASMSEEDMQSTLAVTMASFFEGDTAIQKKAFEEHVWKFIDSAQTPEDKKNKKISTETYMKLYPYLYWHPFLAPTCMEPCTKEITVDIQAVDTYWYPFEEIQFLYQDGSFEALTNLLLHDPPRPLAEVYPALEP